MEDRMSFHQDSMEKELIFRSEPRKPRFIRTRVVMSPSVVGFVFFTGLVLVFVNSRLNGTAGIKGSLGDVVGDVGVALATGAVLFVLERNFFVSERLDKRQNVDVQPLLDDVLEELEKRLSLDPSQLKLAYYGTVRKGLFTSSQEVYRFAPESDESWPQSLELGEGLIGHVVLEQRSLAADVNGWRWCAVPFVGSRRAGCLIAAIPLTAVDDQLTETCWSLLTDFSQLAISILEPVVV